MKTNEIIAEYRNKRNLSQVDAAVKAGLNIKHYQSIERGDIQPRLKSLLKIANAIDIPFDILCKDIDKSFLVFSVISLLEKYDKDELTAFYDILGDYINE